MKNQQGERNPFYGKRHTEETRQKIREAAKHRWARGREMKADSITNYYKLLIVAMIKQAVKDKAADFLESDFCKSFLAAIEYPQGRQLWK